LVVYIIYINDARSSIYQITQIAQYNRYLTTATDAPRQFKHLQ